MRRFAMRCVGGAVRRLRRLPRPTHPGLIGVALTAGLGAAGISTGDPSILLLFGLAGAVVAASVILPVVNLRGLEVERLPFPDVHAGEVFGGTVLLRRAGPGRERLAVVLEDGLDGPYVRPGHALALRVGEEPVALRYEARIKERGRHEVRSVRLSTRVPFGLFEHHVDLPVVTEILVYPRVGVFRHEPLPYRSFSRAMTSTETVREKGQEEFRNLREYRPGDNPRLVAWRATARFGALMVKELEDDLTKRVTVFLESRLPPGAKSRDRLRLERAISFAATLLRELARRRYHLTLYSLGPEPGRIASGRGSGRLRRLMERLAVLRPSPDLDLRHLFALAPEETFIRTLPVIVLPTADPVRLSEALGGLGGRRRPVVFRADGAWERSLFGYHDEVFTELHGGP